MMIDHDAIWAAELEVAMAVAFLTLAFMFAWGWASTIWDDWQRTRHRRGRTHE